MENIITVMLTIHAITGCIYVYDILRTREDTRHRFRNFEKSIENLIQELNNKEATLHAYVKVIKEKEKMIGEMNQHIEAMNVFNKNQPGAVQ